MLTFVIPTWNRPSQLRGCIDSIARQIALGNHESDVGIIVQDDCSADTTLNVIKHMQERYPFLRHHHREEHTDYAGSFKEAFGLVSDGWVWTFGDDDVLEDGALEFVLRNLPNFGDVDFIHICEKKRSANTQGMHKGTLLELCNTFGWIECTGFITGNIVRSNVLREASYSQNWRRYAKTAFVQSCALLEVAAHRQSALVDVPLISSQEQDQTQETAVTWMEQNIPGRYLYVVDAIEFMYEEGILTAPVSRTFFRYLVYHLWDRFLTHYINDYVHHGVLHEGVDWSRVQRFATLIDDTEFAKRLIEDIHCAQSIITLHQSMKANLEGLMVELKSVLERRSVEWFPRTYTGGRDEQFHKREPAAPAASPADASGEERGAQGGDVLPAGVRPLPHEQ